MDSSVRRRRMEREGLPEGSAKRYVKGKVQQYNHRIHSLEVDLKEFSEGKEEFVNNYGEEAYAERVCYINDEISGYESEKMALLDFSFC